jgi:ankyrin repeat protein
MARRMSTTLKEMGKVPDLPVATLNTVAPFPKVMPPIPVRYYKHHPVKITAGDILKKLDVKEQQQVNLYLKECLDTPQKDFPAVIKKSLNKIFLDLVSKQVPADMMAQDHIQETISDLEVDFEMYIKRILLALKQEENELFKKIINVFKLDVKIDAIESIQTMQGKITALLASTQRLLISNTKLLQDESKKIEIEAKKVADEIRQKINANRAVSLNDYQAQWNLLDHRMKSVNLHVYNSNINNINAAYDKKIASVTVDLIKTSIEKENKENIAKINERCRKAIEEQKSLIDNIYGILVSSQEISTKSLINTIPYSALEIANNGYYKEAGDNHRIVGGCGMKLPSLKQVPIPMGEKMVSSFAPVLLAVANETMAQANYNGKNYSLFKLKTKNKPAYSLLDYSDVFDTVVKQVVSMGDNEFNALSELGYERLAQDAIALPKFNLSATDKLGQTTLHYAATFSDEKQLDKIVQTNVASLAIKDIHGHFPIHIAASSGNVDAINYFVAKDAKLLHVQNNNGSTPLVLAVYDGHKAAVGKLISLGSDVNHILPNGLFALYIAIQNGHEEVALALISHAKTLNPNLTLDNGDSALHLAIEMNQPKVALALIACGADITLKRKTDGYSPFYCAIENGMTEICQAMFSTGKVNVNMPLPSGKTAVHLAAIGGHIETLKWLKEKCNADVNAKTLRAETPIVLALQHGQSASALYLASHSTVNVVNEEGQTASMVAAMIGQFDVADILINRGENTQLNDKHNRNYIYYLLRSGQYARYKNLAEKINIDPNISFNGLTSLDIAAMYGHKLLMDFLLIKNAKYTLDKMTGWELIHFAVKSNHLGYLRKWIKTQKDLKHPIANGNDKSKSLSFIAAENGSFECLSELLKGMLNNDLFNSFKGQHLLCAAVNSGKKKIVSAVLEKCDDANIPVNDEKDTVSHVAARLGKVTILKHLYGCGVDFTVKNRAGLTSFHLAILNDDEYLLSQLLELVPAEKWPQDLLSFALENNKMVCFSVLEKKSTQYPVQSSVFLKALTKASQLGQFNTATLLLKLLANYNIPNKDAHPLHAAIIAGHIEIVDLLIKNGADQYQIIDGLNVFSLAVRTQQIEVIRLLQELGYGNELSKYIDLANGIKPKIADAKAINYTAQAIKNSFIDYDRDKEGLLQAIKTVDEAKLKTIIATFPINNVTYAYNNSTLPLFQIAVLMEADWAVKLLLDNGINPLCKDINGFNIYHHIAKSDTESSQRSIKLLDKYISKHKDILLLGEAGDDISVLHISAVNNNKNLLDVFTLNTHLRDRYSNGNSPLHVAIKAQNIDLVKILLKNGIDVNSENDQFVTPLMLASQLGNISLVQLLLSHNADVDKKDIKQNTALHYAIMSENQEVALQLAPLVKNIHTKNVNGNTPFMLAAMHGLLSVVNEISIINPSCQQFNQDGYNAMHLSAIYGYSDIVVSLAQKGFNVDATPKNKDQKSVTKLQLTPLQLSARQGNIDTCQTLISLGASTSESSEFSDDLTTQAIVSSSPETLQLIKLLNLELTAKHFLLAAECDNTGMLSELLLMGLDIDASNEFGQNALQLACINGADKAVALLIEQGIKLDSVDMNGNNSLHAAASKGSVDNIRQLCDSKVALDKQNNEGETALHLACKNGNYPAVLLLLKLGAKYNITDKNGLTPAQLAAKHGEINIVKLLAVLGDRSISVASMDRLPDHAKISLASHKLELNEIVESNIRVEANKFTQIQHAILLNQMDALRISCQLYSASINQKNMDGDTALHFAVSMNNLTAVKILLEFKADQLIFNKVPGLAIQLAFKSKYASIGQLLVSCLNEVPLELQKEWDQKFTQVLAKLIPVFHSRYNLCYAQNKVNEAFSEVDQLIASGCATHETYYKRGHTNARLGKRDAAKKDYAQALMMAASNEKWFVQYQLGMGLSLMADHLESIEAYKEVVKLNKTYPHAYYRLGELYNIQKDYKAAVYNFSEFNKLVPKDEQGIKNLESAKKKLIEVEAQSEVHYKLGLNLFYQNDFSGAIKEANESVGLNPVHSEAHSILGCCYRDTGKLQEALISFNYAITLGTPLIFWVYYNRSLAYSKLNDHQKALEDAKKCLSLIPGHASALARMNEADNALKTVTQKASLPGPLPQLVSLNSLASTAPSNSSVAVANKLFTPVSQSVAEPQKQQSVINSSTVAVKK